MLWAGSQGTRLWGDICTELLLESALGNNVLSGEGGSWAEGDVELRNTHRRGFRQSTRNLRACVALWIVLSWSQDLDVYISSPPSNMGSSKEGDLTSLEVMLLVQGLWVVSCQYFQYLGVWIPQSWSMCATPFITTTFILNHWASNYLHKLYFPLFSVA